MMKLLCATIMGIAMLSHATAEEKSVSLEGITRAEQIIGQLGKPLGTVVRVKGRVRFAELPGKDGEKEVVGRYLVISKIDGKKLAAPLELEIHPCEAPTLKRGDTIDARAYERLETNGTPSGVPRPEIQARGSTLMYHLKWYIVIVDE